MRAVNRDSVPVPPSLADADGPAARERARASLYYQVPRTKAFPFSAYGLPDVVAALNVLFNGKCAYCESSITAVQPTDVEHFRPKGRVADCPDHPGYWWLASNWDNLLASCIDCNRRRYQEVPKSLHETYAGEKVDELGRFYLGKGELFPILGAKRALCATDDHDAENVALIDPTRRDPQEHLIWLQKDGLSVIGPRIHNGVIDPYGDLTYRTFGLNRQGLVDSRTKLALKIRAHIVDIEESLDEAVTLPEPYSSTMQRRAIKRLSRLYESFSDPSEPYSAMAGALLDQETDRLERKYGQLRIS